MHILQLDDHFSEVASSILMTIFRQTQNLNILPFQCKRC